MRCCFSFSYSEHTPTELPAHSRAPLTTEVPRVPALAASNLKHNSAASMSTHLLLRRSMRLPPTSSLSTTRFFSTTPSSRWGNKTENRNLPNGKPPPKRWPKKTPRPLPDYAADRRPLKNEQERREYEEQEWQAASGNALLGLHTAEPRTAPLPRPSAASVNAVQSGELYTPCGDAPAAPRSSAEATNGGQRNTSYTSTVDVPAAPRAPVFPADAGQPEQPHTSNADAPAAPRYSAEATNDGQHNTFYTPIPQAPAALKQSAESTNSGAPGGQGKGPTRPGLREPRTMAAVALAFALVSNGVALATILKSPEVVEYGDEKKFRTPKYAGVGEMEKVCPKSPNGPPPAGNNS